MIDLGKRTLIMGILNVTPDSFSDGGQYDVPHIALDRACRMIDEGADIIDIGGESTRPVTFNDGAPLDASEEAARVVPVIAALRKIDPKIPISIDTYKSSVAMAALDAGATIVNDISSLSYDLNMPLVAAQFNAWVVLMHMPGPPRSLPETPVYADVVFEVVDYLQARTEIAIAAGISTEHIILDPGIGFGKSASENFSLIRRLSELTALGFPVLSGVSRKSFLTSVLGAVPATDRLEGTAAAVAMSIANGADIVRVHDVHEMVRVSRVVDAIVRG